MPPRVEDLRPHLQSFDFRNLFVEGLGWNHHHGKPIHLSADGTDYTLQPLAEKAGFVVYLCEPGADGAIPLYPVRRKIEHQIVKRSFEHMIVFVDDAKSTQVWQWVKREVGQPLAYHQYSFSAGQRGDPLLQRLPTLGFDLDDEEGLTIGIVASRVRQALDVERLTKRFYERFRKELAAFQRFIDGIAAQGDREWYASLMLNRMMFVYFVQKQGFLDGDPDYLRNRLTMVQHEQRGNGSGRFHQFYRLFLIRLFHEGLGQPEAQRAPDLAALLGKVPFLNGGLFEVHDLEHSNPAISIPDEAFEKVFAFFDGYRWHLDERPDREDNEINPDVLGYIFEKYVNQKQMGAYYTKEDITGYISRNTVIPFLFDAARKQCPVAFQPGGGVWRLLQDDPDRYIYPAVGHGMAWKYSPDADPERQEEENELPDEIAVGVDDVSLRDGWNRPAPDAYALPTETWREVVARRRRYAEVRAKVEAGTVHDVNDMVTLNLDIERFAKDVIVQAEGTDLLRAFWHAMRDVAVLDPTCGSGAFLFAALNILEPLYSACIEGMRGFLDDLDRTRRPHHPRALQDFRDVLAQVDRHPSVRYFILKSIVLNNLYGVDIMEEAVEICKLRLFLKLVAQLERYDQIEPLPDIDFNIRAGNTLVGFTSLDAVRHAITMEPDGQHRALYGEDHATLARIDESAEIASRAFDQFRKQQTALGGEVTAADKANLRSRLDTLESELNRFVAIEYRINPEDRAAYDSWCDSHQPFHWFVEFYGVMDRGGFDVIIGNPPYVEYSKIRKTYQAKSLSTERCGNLYALCTERSLDILRMGGRFGFIVQAPIVSTQRMAPLRILIRERSDFDAYATFDDRPSKLFDGMDHCRVCILLARTGASGHESLTATTRYHKWYKQESRSLLDLLQYKLLVGSLPGAVVPKLRSGVDSRIYNKVLSQPTTLGSIISAIPTKNRIYYKITGVGHWFTFTTSPPRFWRDGVEGPSTRESSVCFSNGLARNTAFCCLWSTLHYWLYQARTNCRDFNPSDLESMPIPRSVAEGIAKFQHIAQRITDQLERTSDVATATYNVGGRVRYQRFNPKAAKPIIDEIDYVLAEHYGFTDEELDFIINYDIKYRMGLGSGGRT